jgi:HlyD family secretion protein
LDLKKEALSKPLIWAIGIVAVGGFLAYMFAPRPVPADFATIDRGDVRVSVEGEGKTRVREVYTISAPISGMMERIRLEPGDPVVAEDTVLARIVPADPLFLDARSTAEAEADVKAAESAVSLARAKVEAAEAELDFARSELKRAEELAQRGNIAERTLERSVIDVRMRKAELDTARSDLGVAMSRLASARARLIQPGEQADVNNPDPDSGGGCCVAVRSPVGGEVLTVPDKSARVVTAGETLIEVGNPRDIEAVIDILSTDAVKIRPGNAALIEHWGGGDPLPAIVQRVEPSGFTKISALGIEEQRVNVIIDFTGQAATRQPLGHGFRVEARIIIDEAEDAVRAPISALFRQGDQWHIFVVEDGEATLRAVQTARRNDTHVEITSGLKPGETVILHPSNAIDDGTDVVER